MTVKEYLKQAYRLDLRIDSDIAEMEHLREMACSISTPCLEERHDPNHPNEAPFVRSLEKMLLLEEKINSEIDRLVDLKAQMREVIDAVPDPDERMVLRYRYIHNMTWEKIGDALHADRTTVYRWHNTAIRHVELPDDPIQI